MGRIVLCLILCFLFACSPQVRIKKILHTSEDTFQDHIGLLVYDPDKRETIVDYNSNRYFTPASNTKIFTLLSSLHLIGDSIPAFRFEEKPDSLIIWGTGDPSFLNSKVFHNNRTYDFLKNHELPIYFSSSNFHQDHFGPGWAWDDYNYSYSPERSSFPVYGNLLSLTDSLGDGVKVFPSLFQDSVIIKKTESKMKKANRRVGDNSISFNLGADSTIFNREVPFHVSADLIARLLQDTLRKAVTTVNNRLPTHSKTFYSIPSDSLYKVMMQESDNFVAEQLLQMCAGILSDSLASEIAIEHVKKNFLFDLPDEPQWVDGSGLSRYNLFTPRSIVRLWEKIMLMVPQERLFQLLAVGGKAGTIKNSYRSDPPYIYGKTGTLSNNHCLSGFLLTKKGKVLIFSFMNNNYTTPTNLVRKNMEAVLFEIHERF